VSHDIVGRGDILPVSSSHMLACHPAEEPPSANVVLPAMQHQLPYKRESLTFGF
jgi:hypothetical protein